MRAVSAGGSLLDRENVSPGLREWEAEVWETLVPGRLECAGVPFLFAFGKHKAPWPSAGCEAGDSLSISWGFSGRFGLVSEALSSCPTLVWGSWGSVETDDV